MDVLLKRLRWIILFLTGSIIFLNVFFYISFYRNQIENRKLILTKQIKSTSEQIESVFQRFKNDLSFYFTYSDIELLFQEQKMESKSVRKIRQFFIKYNEFLKDISFTDINGNQFVFNGTTDNYFQKQFLITKNEQILKDDTTIKKFDATGFDVIIVVVDEGIIKANIKLTIDIQPFIKQTFEQNYISRNSLEALCNTNGHIVVANFLPGGEGFSEASLITEKISKGFTYFLNTTLSIENRKLDLISVIYPVNIFDFRFGLIFSEDKQSIFSEVLKNSISLSLFTIIFFISIILFFIHALGVLKENERRLTIANKELEQITLISNHDLQEPLRKIQLFSNRLLQYQVKQGDEKTITYLDKILGFANRMQILLDEVLTYSRINRSNIANKQVDLNKVVDFARHTFDLKIKESGAVLEIGPLPSIEGNEEYLVSLFENLISNSIKFAQPSSIPVIKIHASVLRNQILVFFEDNGIGIDEQYFEKIFKPFQSLISNNGMGMGLSICKKVIEYHKGTISVKSEVNKGTVFVINLPKKQKQFKFFSILQNR